LAIKTLSVSELKDLLMNTNMSLFERYRAMFALRNRNTDEACLALTEGLQDGSALFRHETAFVLGQLQNPVTIPALVRALRDKNEHDMVRHECAEALGSIATEECRPILEEFSQDVEQVVRESCMVALDIYDYETSSDFQYANTLQYLTSS
jgi:deoxyhypusine monooxygenase